ncbi:MAG: beta-lactamase family protein [Proteobacteria bacterium]|nr:beta-lactamase family protein [Pseudomonadota bacterium]
MTGQHPSRRQVLKSAAALGAVASVAGGATASAAAMRATAVNPAIDAVLKRAVDAREVHGVVALAATDKSVIYEGAFGTRNLGGGAAMTIDTVFRIASMTKAVTSVAALQLVEKGMLTLDDPVPGIDQALAKPMVLEGFEPSGEPRLRPAKRAITLRHLLTHTAGFGYELWDDNLVKYVKATGMPGTFTGKFAALRMPLVFDPGERWEYGINVDWAGILVEALSGKALDVYFRDHIFQPLGMKDTGFAISAAQRARQTNFHQRKPDGTLEAQPLETWFKPEFYAGGGGLYSTGRDYLAFARMLLNGGRLNGGPRILKPETVALSYKNAVGNIPCGVLKTTNPGRSVDVNFFPGKDLRWGLAYMLNVDGVPGGRSPGSVTWAGIFNSYYWIDPVKRVTGVYMTQILPFADPTAVKVFGDFERAVYSGLKSV